MTQRLISYGALAAAVLVTFASAFGATGEMGTGRPQFGIYPNLNYTVVGSFSQATIGFPPSCSSLMLTVGTLNHGRLQDCAESADGGALDRKEGALLCPCRP